MTYLPQEYKLDSTVINKYTVKSLMSQAQNTKRQTTVSQVFTMFEKIMQFEEFNRTDPMLKGEIKSIVDRKFTNKQKEKQQSDKLLKYKIDLEKIYPLNKPGNFGRVLERKCRIVAKGVMQYEDNKQAKLKQVKTFINRIQHIQNKDLADLSWYSIQPEKFKFRIIMLDNNQNKKGIYFETYEQAENVRAYFVHKYLKTSINNQFFSSLKYKLLESSLESFVEKIKRKKLIKKSKSPLPQIQQKPNDNLSLSKFQKPKEGNIADLSTSEVKKYSQNVLIAFPKKQEISKKEQPPKKSFLTGFLDDLISHHSDNNQLPKLNQSKKGQTKQQAGKNLLSKIENLDHSNKLHFFNKLRDMSSNKSKKPVFNMFLMMKREDPESDIEEQNIIGIGNKGFDPKSNIKQPNKVQYPKTPSISNGQNIKPESSPNPFMSLLNSGLNSAQSSPIKQSSRINKILSHSRKQESIFNLPQRIPQENSQVQQIMTKKIGIQKIIFKSIEFLQNIYEAKENRNPSQQKAKNPLLFKPIVTVSAYKKTPKQKNNVNARTSKLDRTKTVQDEKRDEFIFNTIIKSVFRNSEYELVPTEGDGIFETNENMKNIYFVISITNFLTNEEINETQVVFDEFCFSNGKNAIVDAKSHLRVKFDYQNTGVASPEVVYKNNQYSESSLFFSFPKIDPEIILKIKTFWQSQAVSSSYYNLQDNFNIFDAVSNSSGDAQPLNWWIDLDEKQYNFLCILQSSSFILGYKLVKPMLYLIRAIKGIQFKIQKIIEMLLSIILNLGKCYYFPEQLNKINYLHRQIGLSKGTLTFENRIFIEVQIFEKFLTAECPTLEQKLHRKNICISHLMLQYTYEMFSRNFCIEVLCEFWNYCSEETAKVPLIFFLNTISLCRLLGEKLQKCNRLSEVRQVFESKEIRSASILINDIKYLRDKYFYKGEGFIEQIKQAFEQKPFEQSLNIYYKRLAEKQAHEKKHLTKYKKQLCQKLQQYVQIEQAMQVFIKPPQPKKYVLHIYFYQVPEMGGKLLIICGNNEYESISSDNNRYFIIGEITERVLFKYIDWKGNHYLGQLQFNIGFNEFKTKIYCEKTKEEADLHYVCGLLTETQIDIIKNNKKYNHFLGPYISVQLVKDEFLKPIREHFRPNNQEWVNTPWFKDLKTAFSHGNKMFDEVSYFIFTLGQQKLTQQEKIQKLKQYSNKLSREFFLCTNEIIYKHILYEFYKSQGIYLKEHEFQCYFNAALQNEFEAPKIIKCRFVTDKKEIKLQKQLIEYHAKKSLAFLYGDLTIDEVISFCQKNVKSKTTMNFNQGEIKILYSTFGKVQLKVIPIKIQNKQFMIDRDKYIEQNSIFHEISQKQPQILMTQIMPSFAKISTILEYVNTNKNVDLRAKKDQQERKVIPQSINLLKYVQNKFKNCILLRYNSFPTKIDIPFFQYVNELQSDFEKPKFKHYYLNNVKESIKAICTCKDHLRFSSNNKEHDQEFDKSIGLYGNLRKINNEENSKLNSVFFWTDNKEQNSIPLSLVCVNYGYGIVRWEKCLIKKFRKKVKQRLNKKVSVNESKAKVQYLVQIKSEEYYVRQYQVKLNPLAKEHLEQQKGDFQAKINQVQTDIKQGFSFLLNPSNLQDFIKSVKRK